MYKTPPEIFHLVYGNDDHDKTTTTVDMRTMIIMKMNDVYYTIVDNTDNVNTDDEDGTATSTKMKMTIATEIW